MLSLQSIPAVAAGVVSRDAGGDAVIVHARSGKVNVVNYVGAFIWNQIVSPEQAHDDTVAFLQSLAERHLITLNP